MLGISSPTHFVVAVVHDRAAAGGAVAERREAGFGDAEVTLHDAAEVLANDRAFREERSVLERVEALFPSAEEGRTRSTRPRPSGGRASSPPTPRSGSGGTGRRRS